MKGTYIIDGYNLIHAVPELQRISQAFGMQRARADLLAALVLFARARRTECTIVFDGIVTDRIASPRVHVISSKGRSADDVIREHVRHAGSAVTIVSSDQEILGTAEANRAAVVRSREFAVELGLLAPDNQMSGRSSEVSQNSSSMNLRPHRLNELREESEKPRDVSGEELEEWRRLFGE